MSIFRIRSNVKNFYLDRLWSRNGGENERFEHFDSLLVFLSIVLLVALILPLRISLGTILVYLLVDFGYPALVFAQWSRCVASIRRFRQTIDDERDWLRKIHGFQLIRPTSSLFDAQLVELREHLFLELRRQFLEARILARPTGDDGQLISSIDLNEFGPLMSGEAAELRLITNLFDPPAIKSIGELCRLQLDETIHRVELRRAESFFTLFKYQSAIRSSIETIRRAKKNCSTFVDVAPLHGRSNRLTSCYFLLRSAAERLFELNEENSKFHDDFQRIINDVRTVIFSLEALRNKSVVEEEKASPSPSSHVESPTEISVSHRFDDEPVESIDEILVGETGGEPEEKSRKVFSSDEFDEHQQGVLREQTRSLMKELENAIEGKKNEWTEREKRLFGDRPAEVEVPTKVVPPPPPSPPSVRRVTPISMLDELKETFSQQNQLDEETFGEDDESD